MNRIYYILTISTLFLSSIACHASKKSLSRELTVQRVTAIALPAIVSLSVRDATGTVVSGGSGVIVDHNIIATCWHVVNGAYKANANFLDGRSEEVVGIIAKDVQHDVVLLYVHTKSTKPIGFGTTPSLGNSVVAIGNPEGFNGTVSTGIVSGFRKLKETSVIQTTAPISPGSSGGALLDMYGHVIGLTSSYWVEGQNLNFAIGAGYAHRLLPINNHLVAVLPLATVTRPATTTKSAQLEENRPLPQPQIIDYDTMLLNLWKHDANGWRFVGGLAEVQDAIIHGADINCKDKEGYTPLMLASITGEIDVVSCLLSNNARLEQQNKNSQTALLLAAYNNQIDVCKILINSGADINSKGHGALPLLVVAVISHRIDTLRFVLTLGIDKDAASDLGETALMFAVGLGGDTTASIRSQIVATLIDSGVNVNAVDTYGVSALMMAAHDGEIDNVKLLVKSGAKTTTMDKSNFTALTYARNPGKGVTIEQKNAVIEALEAH